MTEQTVLLDDTSYPETHPSLRITSPGFAYAACVFEGICVYRGDDETSLIFRLEDHLARLERSMRAVGFKSPPNRALLKERVVTALAENAISSDAHVRLMAFVDGDTRIDETGPVRTAVLVRAASGRPSERAGFHCKVASWRRPPDTSLPSRIKCTANYAIGRMAMLEARQSGADAAILLSHDGAVAEGATANIFMVSGDDLITPRLCDGILEGITRDTLIRLWPEVSGREVVQRRIDRSELINCDGAFFCGSLWEISPILSVDGMTLPHLDARIGKLKSLYQDAVRGRSEFSYWCTPVSV